MLPPMDEQEAFDEAFREMVKHDALDEVVKNLAAVGVTVEPWQRPILEHWLFQDEGLPLSVRVLRLQRVLSRLDLNICQDLHPSRRRP